MEKKNNKLIKRIVFGVNTKTLIITFLVFCFCFQISFSTDISIWPKEIKFNYEPGYSNDAITLKKDNDNYVPVPEWIEGEQENEKCAYIKGQSNRKIQVKFDSNSDNMNFLVKATVITGEGIGEVCEGFISECDLDENRWITLDLNGSLPSSVGIRTFEWEWEATALPINAPYCPITCEPCTTEHTFYTLLDVPQDPMAEPWTDVLDYACIWAREQTTESEVVRHITEGAYNNLGKTYYGGGSHAPVPYFNLTDFLAESWADCRDMSAVVQVFTNALGGSNIMVRSIDYYSGDFWYKPILPIGWPIWSDEDEYPDHWNFHQFGYLSNVFDASLKLKKSSPRIPLNEVIDGSYKADLYQSGDWNKDTPTVYTNVY